MKYFTINGRPACDFYIEMKKKISTKVKDLKKNIKIHGTRKKQ